MLSEREKMVALLDKAYGARKEGSTIEYKSCSNESIAEELGADSGQFSRTLNPPIGKEKSEEAHRKYNTRLELILSNRSKSSQIKRLQMACGGILLMFIASLIWPLSPSKNLQTPSQPSLNLTLEEQRAIFDLYGGYVQYRLTLESLAFNSSVKDNLYQEDELKHQVGELAKRCDTGIEDARRIMRRTHLRNHNGILLANLYEKYSKHNKVDENLGDLIPLLTNKEVSVSEIINSITSKIQQIQHRNESEFEQEVSHDLSNPSSPCCYLVETVDQADKFLKLSSDLNGYQMLYQALLLKHLMDNRSDLSEEDRTFYASQRINEIVESTIRANRLRYRDMGFITPDGRSISDVIEEIQPMAHNIKGASKIVPLLVNKDIPLEDMADLLRGQIRGTQKEHWRFFLENFNNRKDIDK